MKGRFIEGPNLELALQFEPEDDNERLLLRALSNQASPGNRLRIQGWGLGGPDPGLRYIRVYQEARSPAFRASCENVGHTVMPRSALCTHCGAAGDEPMP